MVAAKGSGGSAAAGDPPDAYYYADGQRVLLQADPHHAAYDLQDSRQQRAQAAGGRMLNAHVWLVALNTDDSESSMPASPPAQRLPVFRSGAMLLVALPEVRIEDDDPAHLLAVQHWLAADHQRAALLAHQPGRMTLQAGPALAHDGVTLARLVVEVCGVRSASPRLLRVSPKGPD